MIQEFLKNAPRFAFFQAVYLLQQLLAPQARLGHRGPVGQEAVRFRAHASLAFPTADIEALESADRGERESLPPVSMRVNFFGLYGPASPLPTFYTEELLSAERDDETRQHFLDFFHHRFVALLYRCWEKYRYYVQYQPGATDQWSQWLFALMGVGGKELRQDSHLAWDRLLPYLGLLSLPTSPVTVLVNVVSHYFGAVPVDVEQCVERWVPLAADQRTVLGTKNCTLGEDTTIGERFYDRSGKFRLLIGPLDFATFQRFLPAGNNTPALHELVGFIVRDQLAFDIKLILSEVPALQLQDNSPCCLGWSTWLGPVHDPEVSVVFTGHR